MINTLLYSIIFGTSAKLITRFNDKDKYRLFTDIDFPCNSTIYGVMFGLIGFGYGLRIDIKYLVEEYIDIILD